MLDAVAGWIAAQLSAEHVRSAEFRFAEVVPGIARHIENSPPVEEVTAEQLAAFRARLRRDLPAAVHRAAPRGSTLVLQLGRESVPVVRAVKAAHLTLYYLPEGLEVLLVAGRATGRNNSVLAGPSETVWEAPVAALPRP